MGNSFSSITTIEDEEASNFIKHRTHLFEIFINLRNKNEIREVIEPFINSNIENNKTNNVHIMPQIEFSIVIVDFDDSYNVKSIRFTPKQNFKILTRNLINRKSLVDEQKVFIYYGTFQIHLLDETVVFHRFAIMCRSCKRDEHGPYSLEIGIIEGGGWIHVCESELFRELLFESLFIHDENSLHDFKHEFRDHNVSFVHYGYKYQSSFDSILCDGIEFPTQFIINESNKYSFQGRCQLTTGILIDMVIKKIHHNNDDNGCFFLDYYVVTNALKFLEKLKKISLNHFNTNNGQYIMEKLENLEQKMFLKREKRLKKLHTDHHSNIRYNQKFNLEFEHGMIDFSTRMDTFRNSEMCLAINLFTELWFLEAVNYYCIKYQNTTQFSNIMFDLPLFIASSNQFVYERLQVLCNLSFSQRIITYDDDDKEIKYTRWMLEAMTNFTKLTEQQIHSFPASMFSKPHDIDKKAKNIITLLGNCFVINTETKEAFLLYYKFDKMLSIEKNLRKYRFTKSIDFVATTLLEQQLPKLTFEIMTKESDGFSVVYILSIVTMDVYENFLQQQLHERGNEMLKNKKRRMNDDHTDDDTSYLFDDQLLDFDTIRPTFAQKKKGVDPIDENHDKKRKGEQEKENGEELNWGIPTADESTTVGEFVLMDYKDAHNIPLSFFHLSSSIYFNKKVLFK